MIFSLTCKPGIHGGRTFNLDEPAQTGDGESATVRRIEFVDGAGYLVGFDRHPGDIIMVRFEDVECVDSMM